MKVLIINSGSSSIKYQVIDMPLEEVICEGIVERIGSEDAILKFNTKRAALSEIQKINDHEAGLKKIAELLLDAEKGIIADANEIAIVGHRVVHGGNTFSKTTLIDHTVKEKIKQLFALAPLHNPPNLKGILMGEQIFPNAKQIAVFDTAFHQTIPVKAKKFALPNALWDHYQIQTYGFHGTSHKYVSEIAIAYLQKQRSKIITIHLGNGCSITAIQDGESIDHSMGFAPSNGLIMGTRSGDIDHSIIFYLVATLGYSLEEVNNMLNTQSGMQGLTGFSDLRDIQAAAEKGNNACLLALQMNAYRIKKYIGAYTAAMNGLDAIVFTAGIGENSALLRKLVATDMEYIGIHLDTSKNNIKSNTLSEINTASSKVKVLVIPTNEELEIAKQAFSLAF